MTWSVSREAQSIWLNKIYATLTWALGCWVVEVAPSQVAPFVLHQQPMGAGTSNCIWKFRFFNLVDIFMMGITARGNFRGGRVMVNQGFIGLPNGSKIRNLTWNRKDRVWKIIFYQTQQIYANLAFHVKFCVPQNNINNMIYCLSNDFFCRITYPNVHQKHKHRLHHVPLVGSQNLGFLLGPPLLLVSIQICFTSSWFSPFLGE